VKDAKGKLVRTFSNHPAKSHSNNSFKLEPALGVKKGLNRFVWNLRRQGMPTIDDVYIEGSYNGGRIVPGIYSVTLKVDGQEQSTQLVLQGDPRINVSDAEYAKQDELLKKLELDVTDIHVSVTRMKGLQKQLNELVQLLSSDASKAEAVKSAKGILEKITVWENKLIQPKSQSYDDVINFVNKLSANIIFVHGEMNNNVPYVTSGAIARYEELHNEWLVYKNEMDALLKNDVAAFNALCRSLSIGNVLLPE
jgi:hypothetical protein